MVATLRKFNQGLSKKYTVPLLTEMDLGPNVTVSTLLRESNAFQRGAR
jgi:hypothetical protein